MARLIKRDMVGHVVLLLLVGAVTSDDITCKDVTPFTNFSNEVTGTWALLSMINFEHGLPRTPSAQEIEGLQNSKRICQHFYTVNTTVDRMLLLSVPFAGQTISQVFDAEERKGYFAERDNTKRKMIVVGSDPGKYFAFVMCDGTNLMDAVLVLGSLGGQTHHERSLIMRSIAENLPFNSSYFVISNHTCWDTPDI